MKNLSFDDGRETVTASTPETVPTRLVSTRMGLFLATLLASIVILATKHSLFLSSTYSRHFSKRFHKIIDY